MQDPRREPGRRLAQALAVAVPAAFYWFTCSRDVGVTDSAALIEQMVGLELSSHVNVHNLTVIWGHLFTRLPFGEVAFRANLASAALGALTVVLFTRVARGILASAWLALPPAWALMVSHSLWWHSTIAESYAMNACLTVMAVALLERFAARRADRDLHALFALAGIAVFNHVSMGILLIAGGVALAVGSAGDAGAFRRRLPWCAAALAAGLVPYGIVFARDLAVGDDAAGVARAALGGDFTGLMFAAQEGTARGFLEWIVLQFPSPFLALIGVGLVAAWARPARRIATAALLAAATVNTVFFVQFVTWDEFAFHLPTFVILAWLGVVGMASVIDAARIPALRWAVAGLVGAGVVAAPWIYARLATSPLLPRLAIAWRFDDRYTANAYGWAEFLANPDKRRYDQIAAFCDGLLTALPPNALLFDDDARSYGPLRYYQRRLQRRPDVRIELMNSWGFDDWGLDPRAFLDQAVLHPGRVFAVSEQEPYAPLLAALREAGYRTERFDLPNGRWVEEIVAPAPRAAGRLEDVAVRLVRSTATDGVAPERRFDRGDPVVAEISFRPPDGPVALHVAWRGPDGDLAFANDAGVVPAGARGIAARLELPPRRRARGPWEVEVWSGGTAAGRASFEIR